MQQGLINQTKYGLEITREEHFVDGDHDIFDLLAKQYQGVEDHKDY